MLELFVQLFKAVLQLFLALLNPIFLIPLIIVIFVYAKGLRIIKLALIIRSSKRHIFQ